MNTRHIITLERPASWFGALWKEATPLGNGETGALVYGGVQDETLTLTRYDLWHWGDEAELPDVSETLAESRAAMDNGDWAKANNLLADTLKARGYHNNPATPFPLADLNIHIGTSGIFRHYRRELDMEKAESRITYTHGGIEYLRGCFVSRANGVLFYRIKSDSPSIYIEVGLRLHNDGTPNTQRMEQEQRENIVSRVEPETDGGYIFWRGRNVDGDYGAVARIVCGADSVKVDDGRLRVESVSELTIMVRTFAREDYEQAFERCRDELKGLDCGSGCYERYHDEHMRLYRPLYESCDLSLYDESGSAAPITSLLDEAYRESASPELIEKLWRFGRYLMISGTAVGRGPFPLYGLWNAEYYPVWAQNVANENVQIIYWHILTGGLAELCEPLIDYYYNMLPKLRENAQKLFGCRGIFVSAYTTPQNGYVAPVVTVITNWIGGAGWLCQHFYRYYKYTGSRELFETKILPLMVEAARFYCDYIVMRDGKVEIYPSVSPENSPANFMSNSAFRHLGHAMPAVRNATMDFAIIKELLGNLLSVADEYPELCCDADEWRRVLDATPPYSVNEDGAVKEWNTPELRDFYCHRHLSHIYPVYPGNEITPDNKLWPAFERAVDLRELGGQVGWSLVHMAAIYARFGRGEAAAQCIDLLTKGVMLPNLMMISNDYRSMGVTMDVGQFAPIQLDANMGMVNALQEMLFHADESTLAILPALPERLGRGSVSGFRFIGGRVGFDWDSAAGKLNVRLELKRRGNWELLLPKGYGADISAVYADGSAGTDDSADVRLISENERGARYSVTSRIK